jgi:hypothetical protein
MPDDWRGRVLDLMSRARLVVLALDDSDSTLWEFVEAIRGERCKGFTASCARDQPDPAGA